MNMSNSEIAKMLMTNDHLSNEDKEVLLKILGVKNDDATQMSFSERISDGFTNFIGSWKFIIASIVFIIVWMVFNAILDGTQYAFDVYPYVFLNLVLACIAAIQAPIIMMSQNRQDKRESLKTQSDYEIDLKTIIIIQDLYQKTIDINDKVDKLSKTVEAMNPSVKAKIIELNPEKNRKKDS